MVLVITNYPFKTPKKRDRRQTFSRLCRVIAAFKAFLVNSLIILSILILSPMIILAINGEIHKKTVELGPFDVSKALQQHEITSKRVEEELKKALTLIKTEATTAMKGLPISSTPMVEIDLQIAGAGFSLTKTVYLLKQFLGYHQRIEGEVLYEEKTLRFSFHKSGDYFSPLKRESVNEKNFYKELSSMLYDAALKIYAKEQPYILAVFYYKKKNNPLSIYYIRECLRHLPKMDDSWAINLLGIWAEEQDYIDDAIDHYTNAIDINSQFAIGYFNRGRLYIKKNELGDALANFNMALHLNPQMVEAYYERARVNEKLRNFPLAYRDLKELSKLNPGLADAYNLGGNLLFREGKYNEAQEEYQHAVLLDPKKPQPYNGLGAISFAQKDYKQARIYYRKAIELDSEYIEGHFNLARANYHLYMETVSTFINKDFLSTKSLKEGISHIDKVINLITDNPASAYLLKGKLQLEIIKIKKVRDSQLFGSAEENFNTARDLSEKRERTTYEEANAKLKELRNIYNSRKYD